MLDNMPVIEFVIDRQDCSQESQGRELQATVRWHASARHRDFELLLTGPRFFDSRAAKGGGGAIDLAMHLLQTTFVDAVKALRAAGI